MIGIRSKQLQMMQFNGERWELFGPILTGDSGAKGSPTSDHRSIDDQARSQREARYSGSN